MPYCKIHLKAQRPRKPAYPKSLITLGDHIRKHRRDLGLFQRQAAEQIGVDETAFFHWESNTTRPALRLLPSIILFLRYNPLPKPILAVLTLAEKLVLCGKILGLSQVKLARKLGVNESTLRDWEAEKHHPTKQSLEVIGLFFKRNCQEVDAPRAIGRNMKACQDRNAPVTLAIIALDGFELEAQPLADNRAQEAPNAVRLPAYDGHEVLKRRAVGLAEEFQDFGVLTTLARPVAFSAAFLLPLALRVALLLAARPVPTSCAGDDFSWVSTVAVAPFEATLGEIDCLGDLVLYHQMRLEDLIA